MIGGTRRKTQEEEKGQSNSAAPPPPPSVSVCLRSFHLFHHRKLRFHVGLQEPKCLDATGHIPELPSITDVLHTMSLLFHYNTRGPRGLDLKMGSEGGVQSDSARWTHPSP